MTRIDVVTAGRSGFIVAVETSDREPGTGYDWDATGTASVVGKVYRTSHDEEPPEWKAWLLPVAGQSTPHGQSTTAFTAASPELLAAKLRGHTAKGPWWAAGDGRCPEALEHGGRQSRCQTASVVPHDVHRHYPDGVEWMSEEDYEGDGQ
jgi:hypothetical protein